MPRVSRPAAPASRRKRGRVGRVADRQVGGVEDLVAVQVGDRDLGGRDQVQVVARDDVHLVLLVRDLAGAARGVGVDERPAARPRSSRSRVVWTSRNQLIRARCRFDPAPTYTGQPEPVIFAPRTLSMMPSASASSQCGRRASRGSGSPQLRTVTLASSPPTGTSGSAGFGMRSIASSSSAWTVASSASVAASRSADRGRRGLELGHVRRRPRPLRRAPPRRSACWRRCARP